MNTASGARKGVCGDSLQVPDGLPVLGLGRLDVARTSPTSNQDGEWRMVEGEWRMLPPMSRNAKFAGVSGVFGNSALPEGMGVCAGTVGV